MIYGRMGLKTEPFNPAVESACGLDWLVLVSLAAA